MSNQALLLCLRAHFAGLTLEQVESQGFAETELIEAVTNGEVRASNSRYYYIHKDQE